jgi:hypothetical protein
VEDGTQRCAATPCDVVYHGDEANPGRKHVLTIAKTGYQSKTTTIASDQSWAHVDLNKEAPRPAPARAPSAAREPPPPTLLGFKDLPY